MARLRLMCPGILGSVVGVELPMSSQGQLVGTVRRSRVGTVNRRETPAKGTSNLCTASCLDILFLEFLEVDKMGIVEWID